MALEPSDIYGKGFLEIIRDLKAELLREGCHSANMTALLASHEHMTFGLADAKPKKPKKI
jgi:hypothetical protein